MRILTLLLSTSLLAISSAAHADVSGPAEAPKPLAKQADAVGAVTEIVVTANRREERLQSVPVTVTVVGGEQLTRQNINTVEDLQRSIHPHPTLSETVMESAETFYNTSPHYIARRRR